MEPMEQRILLSGSVASDLLASDNSVLDNSRTPIIEIQPLKKTTRSVSVAPIGGTYRGATSHVAVNGVPLPDPKDFPLPVDLGPVSLSVKCGKRGRVYGTMTWAWETGVGDWIKLAGKRVGNSFVIQGRYDEVSNGITFMTSYVKVSGQSSADGRRLTGNFLVSQDRLAGDDTYTGRFSVRRSRS